MRWYPWLLGACALAMAMSIAGRSLAALDPSGIAMLDRILSPIVVVTFITAFLRTSWCILKFHSGRSRVGWILLTLAMPPAQPFLYYLFHADRARGLVGAGRS